MLTVEKCLPVPSYNLELTPSFVDSPFPLVVSISILQVLSVEK